MPVVLRLFQKVEGEEVLPNSFYKATITLTPKPGKGIIKKENYRQNIFDEDRCKYPQQNVSKPNPNI